MLSTLESQLFKAINEIIACHNVEKLNKSLQKLLLLKCMGENNLNVCIVAKLLGVSRATCRKRLILEFGEKYKAQILIDLKEAYKSLGESIWGL